MKKKVSLHRWGVEAMTFKSAGIQAAVLAVGAIACSVSAGAAPWFGLTLPPPVNDPSTPIVPFDTTDIPVQPIVFGAGPKSPILDGSKMKADLRTIVDFALKSKAQGDFRWGRVVGTQIHRDTVAWIVGQMKSGGVQDSHVEDYSAKLSIPDSAEVRILGNVSYGDGSQDVVLKTADAEGRGPVNGTVTAPLVYVGHATDADLIGRDLTGKIAVMDTTPSPGMLAADEFRREPKLIKAGAVGVINIMQQIGNMQSYSPFAGCTAGMCFSVGGEDGYFLESAIGKAGLDHQVLTARLSATAKQQNGLVGENGVATIPGKTNRTIVLNFHADSWYTGADDNGSGTVVGIALARYFAKQPQLNHTLVFLVDGGHHTQPGIPEFRKKHEDLIDNADLFINLEHVAAAGLIRSFDQRTDVNFANQMVPTTTEWPKEVSISNRAPFLIDTWRKAATCFMIPLERVVESDAPGEPSTMHDVVTKIPVTQMTEYGPLYHTTGEGLQSVTDEGLERAARFFAYMIKAADKASPALLKGAPYSPTKGCPAIP